MIRVAGIVKESVVDGPGIRYVIFAQGCLHACEGCHNKKTWSLTAGTMMSIDDIVAGLDDSLASGVTFSGGEPVLQREMFVKLAKKIREKRPDMNIISYSGYTFEEIQMLENGKEFLENVDMLIDGRFELANKTFDLPFRGSTNQRCLRLCRGEIEEIE